MIARQLTKPIWLSLCLLTCLGCGRRPSPPVTPPEETAPGPTSHELGESTITVVDPEGRWTFQVQAQRVEAASVDGPYDLEPADCRYDEPGRPPVLMRAARARLDKKAENVILEGDVSISSGAWVLEADRVEYDLNAGKVVAPGRTKWAFTEGPTAGREP